LIGLLKIILLWWIITVVVTWYRRMKAEKSGRQEVPPREDSPGPGGRIYSGKIEDAEYEDIDDQNRGKNS
jgi:hypothetical protein